MSVRGMVVGVCVLCGVCVRVACGVCVMCRVHRVRVCGVWCVWHREERGRGHGVLVGGVGRREGAVCVGERWRVVV